MARSLGLGPWFWILPGLLILTFVVVIGYVTGDITEQDARVYIAALGVLATILLFSGTVISVRQNQKSIEEMELERKRPIYEQLTSDILEPLFADVKQEKRLLKSGAIFLNSDEESVSSELFSPTFEPKFETFKAECQCEYQLCDKCNSKLEKLFEQGEKTTDEIIIGLEEQHKRSGIIERQIALNLMFPGRSNMGNDATQAYWTDNKESLQSWFFENYSEEYQELKIIEYEIIQILEKLEHQLLSRMRQYQEKYGISFSHP